MHITYSSYKVILKMHTESGEEVFQKCLLVCFQKPIGQGPLPEYEYWQERQTGLGILLKQLKSPNVEHIFEILHAGGSQIGEGFTLCQDNLLKYCVLAQNNTKFLSTISWHFKVIMGFIIVYQILASCLFRIFSCNSFM